MFSNSNPNSRPTALSVADARLAYGDVVALDDVSFELKAGEILGLLGPNGAGKTSLLRCLSGRQKLDRGEVICFLNGYLKDILGIVPQEIALYQDLTVLQNLSVFARLQGIPRRDTRELLAETLDWAGLREKSKSLVRRLSGGMQRRLNIACSVLHQPKILFLDEPTVGVDPQSRERIYLMLQSLLDEGTAIMLTTHHLEEAQERCDRIAIIDQGRILDIGTFDELIERTIGSKHQLRVRFSQPQLRAPEPFALSRNRLEATCTIERNGQELPQLLSLIQQARLPMEQLSLNSPTLQNMFLHMTGKELRE